MEKEQCSFYEHRRDRCIMRASKDTPFCMLHQNRFADISNEELMKEIGKAIKSYIRESPTNHYFLADPLGMPDKAPLLANLITEAVERGYKYKDLKLYIKKIHDEWLSRKGLRFIKHI